VSNYRLRCARSSSNLHFMAAILFFASAEGLLHKLHRMNNAALTVRPMQPARLPSRLVKSASAIRMVSPAKRPAMAPCAVDLVQNRAPAVGTINCAAPASAIRPVCTSMDRVETRSTYVAAETIKRTIFVIFINLASVASGSMYRLCTSIV